MARTYEQLQQQIAALQAQAEKLRRKEFDDVVARIREAVRHYGITAADLGLSAQGARAGKAAAGRRQPGAKATNKRGKAAPAVARYRDEAGNAWVGRGKRPQWLRDALAAGRSLDEFRVRAD